MWKKRFSNVAVAAAAAIGLSVIGAAAQAAELPVGTVISASNLDKVENDTFEGHKIKDLLTPGLTLQIRQYGLDIPLAHSTPLPIDPAWVKATDENAGKAKLVPDQKYGGYRVEGWTAGAPFPESHVSVKDPMCGWKLVWDYRDAQPYNGLNGWSAIGEEYIINAKKGIINHLVAANAITRVDGRVRGKPVLPDALPHEFGRFLLAVISPFNLAGIGTYERQFNNGQPNNDYVYLRALRRTRQVAGGKAWTDPQPKTNFLEDDDQGLQANPVWYTGWHCVGVRYLLTVHDMPDENYANRMGKKAVSRSLNIDQPPYWNYVNTGWQPTKVFVLEGTPPSYHPYGKKVLYMDAKYPFFYQSDFYDKSDKLWRMWETRYSPYWNGDCNGAPGLQNFSTWILDLKLDQVTYINQTYNGAGCIDPSYLQPNSLQDAANGGLLNKLQKLRAAYLKKSPLPQYKKVEEAWIKTHGEPTP